MGEKTKFVGKRRNKAESTSGDDIGGFERFADATNGVKVVIRQNDGDLGGQKAVFRGENGRGEATREREKRRESAREEGRERAVK